MATISELQSVLSRVAQERSTLERVMTTSSALQQAMKALNPPHLRVVSELAAAMKRHESLFAELARPPKIISDIQRQIESSRRFFDEFVSPMTKIHESLRQQATIFEGIASRFAEFDKLRMGIPDISRTVFAWEYSAASLANRMRDIDLFAKRDALATRLLSAPRAYADFVQQTTERLANPASERVASHLRGSLALAESQLVSISGTLSDFVTIPDDEDEPFAPRPLTAPLFQQNELAALDSDVDESDIERLSAHSATAGLVGKSKSVLQLVTVCNEASKTSTGVEIFRPTTRLLEVFADLPWMIATDRNAIASVVDCLYFIFYEGAGKDNLRFMAKNGGPLGEEDCDLIWCIKHLRNKWTRHDADHGKDKDIQKSWQDLAAKFRWLDLTQHPTQPDHFRLLQRRLLEESEAFLKLIMSKLTLRS